MRPVQLHLRAHLFIRFQHNITLNLCTVFIKVPENASRSFECIIEPYGANHSWCPETFHACVVLLSQPLEWNAKACPACLLFSSKLCPSSGPASRSRQVRDPVIAEATKQIVFSYPWMRVARVQKLLYTRIIWARLVSCIIHIVCRVASGTSLSSRSNSSVKNVNRRLLGVDALAHTVLWRDRQLFPHKI
jgi:hypothetical protein